jgi:sialic acid synthase SpsE
MQIGSFDTDEKVLIIAEIGNNHEGDFGLAQGLVKQAAECGADAVKFQTFVTEHFVSRKDKERFQRLKSFELPGEQFVALSELAHSLGLLFVSTPLDLGSADLLEPIVDAFKIASSDNNFYPLIERVARTDKPIIISTGLADEEQVARTIRAVEKHRPEKKTLALLHCVTAYPVPSDQINLEAIRHLSRRQDVTVGYSDHALGIEAAVLSVAMGARVIEKHFTLDKNYSEFRDHKISADPTDMRELVRQVGQASSMLGRASKSIQPIEEPVRVSVRRSIVAGRSLPEGHKIEWRDLMWIRPGGGLAPGEEQHLIGKKLRHPVDFGEQLTVSDVE